MILFILFPFLALGCLTFLVCAAIQPLRKFALGASLWCVACAPCLLTVLALILLITAGFDALHKLFDRTLTVGIHLDKPSWLGWLLMALALAIVIAGATAITLLHGVILRRTTLALFRLYLAGVSFGVAVLSVLLISTAIVGYWYLLSATASQWPLLLSINAVSLIAAPALAYACYKNARQFRGKYPNRFPIVTMEEFN